jgi:hypothetical protein
MKDFLKTNYPLVDWTDLAPFMFKMSGNTVQLNLSMWPSDVYATPPTQSEITTWHNS